MTGNPPEAALAAWFRLLLFQGGGFVLTAATIAMAAVVVPPDIYGQYGILLSSVQIVSGVGFLWVNQGLLRFGRQEFKERGSTSDTLAAALALMGALLLIVLLVLLSAADTISPALGVPVGALALLASALVAFIAFETMNYAAQAAGRLTGYTGGQIISRLGLFCAVGAMASGLETSAMALLAGSATGWAVAALFTSRAAFSGGFRPSGGWPSRIRPLVTYGRWLPVSSAAGVLSQWSGMWILRYNVDLASAGIFLWSAGLFTMLAGLLQPLAAVLAPRMIDLRVAEDHDGLNHRLDIIGAGGLLLTSLMPAGLALLYIVAAAAFPAQYAAGSALVVVLFASLPSLLVGAAVSPLISAFETMVPRLVAVSIASSLANVAMLFALIPLLGMRGAAISTSVSSVVLATALLTIAGTVARGTSAATPVALRHCLAGVGALVFALVILELDQRLSLLAGVAVTLTLVCSGRNLGLFASLATLRPFVTNIPRPFRAGGVAALDWISRRPLDR